MRGTSPRARGAAPEHGLRDRVRGNIPACTGSRDLHARPQGRPGEHPRVHGEQGSAISVKALSMGTSPRARGAGHPSLGGSDPVGNIPACTGRSAARSVRQGPAGEHPRVHGEQLDTYGKVHEDQGTSPRARGVVPSSRWGSRGPGNIPACTGSRPDDSAGRSALREHPRVHGEQNPPASRRGLRTGTSPCARGADYVPECRGSSAGNISACTGSSPDDGGGMTSAREHPRVHGEQRTAGAPPAGDNLGDLKAFG